jgi:hypothetical protein
VNLGHPRNAIARQFGISGSALTRHKSAHMTTLPSEEAQETLINRPDKPAPEPQRGADIRPLLTKTFKTPAPGRDINAQLSAWDRELRNTFKTNVFTGVKWPTPIRKRDTRK